MQVIVFNSRVVLRPTIRTKIKRRLKEGVRLIVTRGAAAEESRRWPKIVFHAEAVGADKDCAWCVRVPPHPLFHRRICLRVSCRLDLHRIPHNRYAPYAFTEQIDLMRKAPLSLYWRIPEVERILRHHGRRDAALVVHLPQVLYVPPLKNTFTIRMERRAWFAVC